MFLPGARRAIPSLAVALGGLATAVLATHLNVAIAGSEVVTPWAGGALSLYWIGLVGAAVVGIDAIAPAGLLTGAIALLAAAGAVVPMLAVPLAGPATVVAGTARSCPPWSPPRPTPIPGSAPSS